MQEPTQNIAEMEKIIQSYTTIFLVFDIVFFAMIFAGVILLIHFIKSKKNLQDSNEYLLYTIKGQEEERERIARELHDTVAQNIRYCKALCENDSPSKNNSKITEILSKSLAEVRAMSYNLSPPDIAKNDFIACIKNLCQEFQENSNIDLRLSIIEDSDASFLDKSEILNLYRIIQESFTNIQKHSKAKEVVVLIRRENGAEEKGLYIFISDDGIGFEEQIIQDGKSTSRKSEKHFGLIGMQKRAKLIQATVQINSAKGEGTQISIFKPVNAKVM